MATPQKKIKPDDAVVGFIHDVSPVKASPTNTKYFNAIIQTASDEYHNMVFFSPTAERVAQLAGAADKKTPVSVKRVSRSLSYTNPGKYDVTCNRQSIVEAALKKLPFHAKSPPQAKTMTIEEIKEKAANLETVAVIIKVMEIKDTVTRLVGGVEVPLQKVVVADRTAAIEIALWQDQVNTLEANACYTLHDVTVKIFGDTKSLSFGKKAKKIPSTDIGEVSTYSIEDSVQTTTVTGAVSSIVANMTNTCQACSKTISMPASDTPFVRCGKCNFKQRFQALKPTTSIKFALETKEKFTAFHSTLVSFLTPLGQQQLLSNVDELENFFLSQQGIKIKVRDNIVIEMQITKEGE